MGSGFSIRGLGEPIQQLRELLKDFWYRNSQEKQKGEIELLQQRIELLRRSGFSSATLVVIASQLHELAPDQALVLLLDKMSKMQPNNPVFSDHLKVHDSKVVDPTQRKSKSKSKRNNTKDVR